MSAVHSGKPSQPAATGPRSKQVEIFIVGYDRTQIRHDLTSLVSNSANCVLFMLRRPSLEIPYNINSGLHAAQFREDSPLKSLHLPCFDQTAGSRLPAKAGPSNT